MGWDLSRDSDTSPNFSMSGSRSQDEKEAANMLSKWWLYNHCPFFIFNLKFSSSVSLGNSSRSTTPANCFSPNNSVSPRAIQSPVTVGPKGNVFMPISHPHLASPTGPPWPGQEAARQAASRQDIIRYETLPPPLPPDGEDTMWELSRFAPWFTLYF